MKKFLFKIFAVFTLAAGLVLAGSGMARAQFSRPVIVMKGCVLTVDQKPATVRLSIHETGAPDNDTSDEITTCAIQEITAGRANSQSGRYLLILKPDTKYWVHIEGTFVQSVDTLIQMPKTDKPLTIDQNFTVNWRQAPDPATLGANDAPAGKKE
ncbi:MAG TPA: hypothetical protein VFH95_07055 [Candidatus Kapabacteria bacterium]|nr:hypothetical protein [Candidatus Kapabacteria bacterium]